MFYARLPRCTTVPVRVSGVIIYRAASDSAAAARTLAAMTGGSNP